MRSQTRKFAALGGVVFVALMIVVLALPSSPSDKATGEKVIAFFRAHHAAVQAQNLLLAYAALALVVFFAALATYLRSRGANILATTTVGGAVLAAAGMCMGAGLSQAGVAQYKRMTPSIAQTINLLGDNAFGFMLFAGMTLAWLAAGLAMVRTSAMPRPVAIIAVVIGVASATEVLSWIAFLAGGLLTLYVSWNLYQALARPTEITLPGVPAARESTQQPQATPTA
jgi:hypothetical protein